ncbi:MAG: TonB-dependent receptor plug domain-containing protein [Bacteroidaceae bacterium]|nr:TonB-dependent receptor plug domain-containing protein [Bacteroidaceae bacterium]
MIARLFLSHIGIAKFFAEITLSSCFSVFLQLGCKKGLLLLLAKSGNMKRKYYTLFLCLLGVVAFASPRTYYIDGGAGIYGFTEQKDSIVVDEQEEELDEVIVSTRGTRTIKRSPTRIEVLSGEEISEKAMMKPGDIRVMLSETTGIQMQQTSPISGNALIRIQGLDGRYTQVLKDGFPAFPGAASGLGLLQTPPLDLRQVEVIKGSSSTLYGGGAIAGLVNLISKTPTEERDLSFLLNGTTARGLDLSGFFGQRFGKIGTTVFASYNTSRAYDPSDVDFSAIPQYDRVNISPKLFLYLSPETNGSLGLNSMIENRLGGDMHYIRGKDVGGHSHYERNKSQRHSLQLNLNHWFSETSKLNLKGSATYFHRSIEQPGYLFEGTQWTTFGELAYSFTNGKAEWVGGLNLWTDHFSEDAAKQAIARDYTQTTFGAFVQGSTSLTPWFSVEAGLRTDYVIDYGLAFLPRLSLLFKPTEKLSSRLGGGFGYKTPTIFTEESERIAYRSVLPVSDQTNKMERSWGANWDVNYTTGIWDDNISLSINHMFFYTRLDNTLLMKPFNDGQYKMVNIDGHTDTMGWETNLKIGWRDFHYYFGYTYTRTKTEEFGQHYENFLTPRHRLNNVLMYEVENKWKVGLEAYYYSPQRLSDGTRGQSYWLCGFMVEKSWRHFSVFVNFENFTDSRQTRFDTIYTGSRTNPEWRDIYAPLDGFVANAGIKIRL